MGGTWQKGEYILKVTTDSVNVKKSGTNTWLVFDNWEDAIKYVIDNSNFKNNVLQHDK